MRISSAATRCSRSRVSRPPRRPAAGAASRIMSARSRPIRRRSLSRSAGDDIARLEASPHLEGFRARGVEVLLLPDPVDNFWVMSGASFEGKPFKSVTQGAADLALIAPADEKEAPTAELEPATRFFSLHEEYAWRGGRRGARLRAAHRQRGLSGRLGSRSRPGAGKAAGGRRPADFRLQADPRSHPRHELIAALATLGDDARALKEDATHLLFDEARVLEGDRVAEPRLFAERLARVLGKCVGKNV